MKKNKIGKPVSENIGGKKNQRKEKKKKFVGSLSFSVWDIRERQVSISIMGPVGYGPTMLRLRRSDLLFNHWQIFILNLFLREFWYSPPYIAMRGEFRWNGSKIWEKANWNWKAMTHFQWFIWSFIEDSWMMLVHI